ncbi:MAG: AmmeMemoRadiSam system protein B [Alphaproteobacteria bacterium]|nr:AmmeMemoRadiSam system protein B [Alphaproteobacteria bacterium]
MDSSPGQTIRPEAVAGTFYPGEGESLMQTVRDLIDAAETGAAPQAPKALIVPHAGFVYSGPVAASAYASLAALKGRVRRVVLIGPSHFKAFFGIAAPTVQAFATPAGAVNLDRAAIDALVADGLARPDDAAHREEHALEVQLPFLMAVLGDFALVPLVVGDASSETVAAVLEALWDGPETLIVASTDLSHYHASEVAEELDGATARAIEALDGGGLTGNDACGYQAVAGLLLAARRHGLSVTRLDLRNSGDTAGGGGPVVGYGAWALAAG